ncbi:MAG: CBS domain-containing protein [Nocardioides sp.]|nr:CBS domain-containing protein [Nocardioides sp.]
MLVRDVMTVDPITVTPDVGVKTALRRLAHLGITSMPVVDEHHRLCGVVSEVDLIGWIVAADPRAQARAIEMRPLTAPKTVEDVYTRSPIAARPDQDVAAVVDVMGAKGFKSLPVVDDMQRLVGVVSRSDVVLALARDDTVIAEDIGRVFRDLGHDDWQVEVIDGVVEITGPDAVHHSLALTIARTVPGVVGVRIP